MVLFGLSAHRPSLLAPRIAGLALAAACIFWGVFSEQHPAKLLGLRRFARKRIALLPLCAILGGGLAVYYRLVRGQPAALDAVTSVGAVCGVIGLAEELAYRGFVQGSVQAVTGSSLIACLAGGAAHAAYKCSLFVFVLPANAVRANLFYLGTLTFGTGVLLGLARARWGSILFAVAFHVAFDVVAYGDLHTLPWWVRP